jgi:hypothetical protein
MGRYRQCGSKNARFLVGSVYETVQVLLSQVLRSLHGRAIRYCAHNTTTIVLAYGFGKRHRDGEISRFGIGCDSPPYIVLGCTGSEQSDCLEPTQIRRTEHYRSTKRCQDLVAAGRFGITAQRRSYCVSASEFEQVFTVGQAERGSTHVGAGSLASWTVKQGTSRWSHNRCLYSQCACWLWC